MKLLTALFNRKYFLLYASFFALIFVQQDNGMMPSKQHQAIAFNRAQATKARNMRNPVWVKTADGHIVPIEQWKIDQMKALQVMLVHQKGGNSQKNPIKKSKNVKSEQWFSVQELNLLSDALDAASMGQFEEFYTKISDQDVVRMLISTAGKAEATGMSALCGTYFFPDDIKKLVVKDMVQPIIMYIKNNIDSRLLISGQKTIRSVAFSPDGTKIASGSWSGDNRLIIWDAQTGRPLHKLLPAGKVISVSFSYDNKKIAVGCHGAENGLTVWDVQTGSNLLAISTDGDVRSVAFSPDDKIIVSGCSGGTHNLAAWDAVTGNQLWTGYDHNVNSIAFSIYGTQMVSGSFGSQNNLIIWNPRNGKKIYNMVDSPSDISSVAFSPDGTKIVSGSSGNENNLIIWDAQSGEQIYNLAGHLKIVNAVAWSLEGEKIVSGNEKGDLIVWDARVGKQIYNLSGYAGSVLSVAFSPDGKTVVSGGQGEENNVTLWKLPSDLILSIKNEVTIIQVQWLYQLYCAAVSDVNIVIKKGSSQEAIYHSLPDEVKKEVCRIFPVMFEKCIVEESSRCCIS